MHTSETGKLSKTENSNSTLWRTVQRSMQKCGAYSCGMYLKVHGSWLWMSRLLFIHLCIYTTGAGFSMLVMHQSHGSHKTVTWLSCDNQDYLTLRSKAWHTTWSHGHPRVSQFLWPSLNRIEVRKQVGERNKHYEQLPAIKSHLF